MIEKQTGNILHADVEALVNTVNCVGIMGRGIALQFRKAFPANYKAYRAACDRKELHPGMMFVYEQSKHTNPRFIINFPTKRHWKGKSRNEDIEVGLKALIDEVKNRDILSIAIPPLGCGLGGLNWSEVRPRIEQAFQSLPEVRVLLFEPTDAASFQESVLQKHAPEMTSGRAALLTLMNRYLFALMDPFVSLLEIHKLMYFMQVAGEPLRLRYNKGFYGPYANNLKHVLNKMEGFYVQGYRDDRDLPDMQLELTAGAVEQAEIFLRDHLETRDRLARVEDLIEGFETSYGMELLSTVHWVIVNEGASSPDEAVEKTFAWNRRKEMFAKDQIHLAWEVLDQKGWLA